MSDQGTRAVRSARSPEVYQTMTAELVRTLRGAQSQGTLSRRLGFSSNVIYHWENGRRFPTLSSMMQLAMLAPKSEKGSKLAKKLSTPKGVQDFITEITVGQSLNELAEHLELNRSSLSRWRAGLVTPDFPRFLHLFDLGTGQVLDFLSLFVEVSELPSCAEEWEQLSQIRALANLMPIFVPLLCALDLAPYRALPAHDASWLARRLRIEPRDVRFALERMLEVGVITLQETHYVPTRQSVDLFLSAQDLWLKLGLKPDLSGYYAGAISQEMLIMVRSEMQNLLSRIHTHAEQDDNPKDQLIMVMVQLARLDHET